VSTHLRAPPAPAHPARPAARPAAPPRRGRRRIPRDNLPVEPAPWLDGSGAFRVAQPALDEFPIQIWSRLVARRTRLLRGA